jgi:hypothetical protein
LGSRPSDGANLVDTRLTLGPFGEWSGKVLRLMGGRVGQRVTGNLPNKGGEGCGRTTGSLRQKIHEASPILHGFACRAIFLAKNYRRAIGKGKLMARGKGKPRSQSKGAAGSRAAVTSLSKGKDEKANEAATSSSSGRRSISHERWFQALVAAITILGGGLFALLIVYIGESRAHESTKAQLARAEDAKKQADGDKQQAISERDQSRRELVDLRKENADLRQLHPILEFYGPRAKYTASYDLRKETGSTLEIGKCPSEPCIIMKLLQITKGPDGMPYAELAVGGRWEGFYADRDVFVPTIGLALKRGCKATFYAGPYHVTFVIEEDRVSDLKAGVGISIASDVREGLFVEDQRC